MKRALVTGASGFVGSHLVQHLLDLNWRVTCLVRDPARLLDEVRSRVEIVEGDICNPPRFVELGSNFDCVFHLAARTHTLNPAETRRVNVDGTEALLNAVARAERVPVVVLVSSLAACGPSPTGRPCNESTVPSPVSVYGWSKLAAERKTRSFSDRIPISIVRPGAIFGSRDDGTWQLMAPVVKYGIHLVPGWRTRRVSATHVHDLTHLLVRCFEAGERLPANRSELDSGGVGIYCVGTEEQPTYADFGKLIGDAVGRDRVFNLHIPSNLLRLFGLVADLLNRIGGRSGLLGTDKVTELVSSNWTCDVSKIQQHLGFVPEKSLGERWQETAAWFRDEGCFTGLEKKTPRSEPFSRREETRAS